ncbi:MAG: histidine phosphatase family protein, partial [Planctomycetia bacterium]|nr:histidine phosphatase family protein [Planctomycetia bacterium]
MPDHLIVIRAGMSDYDEQGRIRGTLAMPLSSGGTAAARLAARILSASPPDALYTSGDACALETARAVGEACGLRPRRIADLTNLDQGLWQGMLVDEIREKQPRLYRQWQDNPWAVAPPEGELLEEACLRVEAALEKLVRRHPSGRVAVVVPQPLDQILRWTVSGETMGDLWAG